MSRHQSFAKLGTVNSTNNLTINNLLARY